MFLLYVDESGSYLDADGHFVVGGLAVHEADMGALRQAMARAVARHLDPHLRGLEIHAQHVLSGKGAWRGIPKSVRSSLVTDLSRMLGRFGKSSRRRPYALFSTVHAPGAVKDADVLERTFEELLLRFHEFLVRANPEGPGPRGLVIADDARYESTLQPVVEKWRAQGTRFKKLRRIVEVPLFCDSGATPLIQLADLVAHGVYRRYVRGDRDSIFSHLLPGFDEVQGVMHGLVHLARDYGRCPCIACSSRRRARRL